MSVRKLLLGAMDAVSAALLRGRMTGSGKVGGCIAALVKQLRHGGFAGFRFPPDVIMVAVRWYLRYGLSDSDVEKLLAERGIEVTM